MRKFLSKVFLLTGMLALAACGGGGGDSSQFEKPGQTGGTGGTGGSTATAITATSSVPSIPSDGSAPATITALVRDGSNNLMPGVAVTFTASSGGIAVGNATTDNAGAATATLSTAGDPTLRTITVTVKAGSLTSTVTVGVVAGSTATTVQMGSLVGATFTPNAMAIGSATLSAGGSTSLQVALQKSDSTLYTQNADVSFSSPCIAQGLATVHSPVTTNTGIAYATYVAKGCSGADVITATATVGGSAVSATGNITVTPASIGSIVFQTASVAHIALKGTGNAQHPETSTVVFQVLDSSSGPRAGATVTFALNTAVGGITLNPTTGISDAQGKVQTVVQGGTVATTVRVTATVTAAAGGQTIATQSNLLTVTTGIPDQDSFSLAVTCPNVEALNKDGVIVGVSARLSDRFNNPVPSGTAVTFTTEGGSIQSQCATGTLADGPPSGASSVNWTSSNPRPIINGAGDRAGRATVLATAIGEESFTDGNGNGSFDSGETFADLPEPFVDLNEDGVYQAGVEPIYDFNIYSTRDAPDGMFNGVLCTDTARCDATSATSGFSASTLIILSGSTPIITPTPAVAGVLHVPASSSKGFSFNFADVNDNPLASGTQIQGDIAGTGFSLGDPKSFTYPCADEPLNYSFTINSGTGATGGTLTLTVTSPSGVKTTTQYSVQTP